MVATNAARSSGVSSSRARAGSSTEAPTSVTLRHTSSASAAAVPAPMASAAPPGVGRPRRPQAVADTAHDARKWTSQMTGGMAKRHSDPAAGRGEVLAEAVAWWWRQQRQWP